MTHVRITVGESARWLSGARALATGFSIDRALGRVQLILDITAISCAYSEVFGAQSTGVHAAVGFLWLVAAVALGVLCLAAADSYATERPVFEHALDNVASPLKGALAGAAIFLLVRMSVSGLRAHDAFIYACAVVLLVIAERAAVQLVLSAARYSGHARMRLLVVGQAGAAQRLASELGLRFAPGVSVAGFCFAELSAAAQGGAAATALRDRIAEAAARYEATDMIAAADDLTAGETCTLVQATAGVLPLRVASRRLSELARRSGLKCDRVGDTAVIEFGGRPSSRVDRVAKGLFDRLVSAAALAAALPFCAFVAALLLATQGRPILFRQNRVRRNGEQFTFYKFRTMVNDEEAPVTAEDLKAINEVDGPMFKCHSDPRVTRVGRWLRRFSLDEIPQLVNVLKGDISLVGVRPPLPGEVACYEGWHMSRLSGWMGVTGLWQVSGRSDLDFDDVVILDLLYNANFSLARDVRIAWRTAGAVLSGKGAY